MTGQSAAALTMAQATRWVNDSFFPAALSALRRASKASTGTDRKLVAVGIDRLSFMNFTSVAAGPRIGLLDAPAGGAGPLGAAAWPLPSSADITSALVTRPRGPEPATASRSTPWALAMRAATGVALPLPLGAPSAPAELSVATGLAAGCVGP